MKPKKPIPFPALPTYAMLLALAGDPVILAASDEIELRRRYVVMRARCLEKPATRRGKT
jgi:hypothetical protein